MATQATGEDPSVRVDSRGSLRILVLNRPATLNALTLEMVRLLRQGLDAAMTDPGVAAVLLRGTGEKAFCAGGDIRAICDSYRAGNDDYLTFFREEYALDNAIHNSPKPVVTWMDGYVMGGGMGLSQGSAVRLVTDRSRLAMPEVGIGYFPDVGGSYFLSRLPGALGLYLGITGTQVRAADALYCGLADQHVALLDEDTLAARLAGADWSKPPREAVAAALGDQATASLPAPPLAALREAIDQHFSAPGVPAIQASLASETRPAFEAWAKETLATLKSRSPIAMSVTWEQLRRARSMSLAQCLQMEYEMDREWLPRGDLVEGVRALIVDKDRNPRWNPQHLDDVDADLVASFFPAADAVPSLVL